MNAASKKLVIPPISAAAPGPLYQQIVEGLKREIGEGRLLPGQALPSFRTLAEDLLVSLITVRRAYEELEREGIIYRKQGLGAFVCDEGAGRSRKSKIQQSAKFMRQAVREAVEAGLNEREILDMARQAIREEKGESPS